MMQQAASASAAGDALVIVCNSRGRSLTLTRLHGDSGRLDAPSELPFPEVAGHSWACPMAVSPDGRFLYLGFRGEPPALLSFAIDLRTSSLAYLGKVELPVNLAYLSTDRSGRFLFGASYVAGAVTLHSIAADGRALARGQVLPTGPRAHCILPTADNRLVLATNMADDAVLRFRFDAAAGRLTPAATPAATVAPGTGPRHLVLHPGGRFAYVINEYVGSVDAFGFDPAAGEMTWLQSHTLLPDGMQDAPAATDLHLTPDGAWLYAAERTSSTLTGFAVDATTGGLTPVFRETTALAPRGFAIDPTGRYLLAAGLTDDQLISYAIEGRSGRLRRLQEIRTGAGPNWVEIVADPRG